MSLLLLCVALAWGGDVDLNAATLGELETLRGVGPSKAASIVAWREARGPCVEAEEILEVPGIGLGTWRAIQPSVRCGPSLGEDAGLVLHPPPPFREVDATSINHARAVDLLRLAGMTPSRAGLVVGDRDARGSYSHCREVARLDGFGPATLAVWGDRCTTSGPPPVSPAPER